MTRDPSDSRFGLVRMLIDWRLLLKDRDAEVAGLDALRHADLEDLENLLDRCARFQRVLDMPTGSRRVHVCERSGEGHAQELTLRRRQDPAAVNAGARRHEWKQAELAKASA